MKIAGAILWDVAKRRASTSDNKRINAELDLNFAKRIVRTANRTNLPGYSQTLYKFAPNMRSFSRIEERLYVTEMTRNDT